MKFDQRLFHLLTFLNREDTIVAVLALFILFIQGVF